MSRTFGVPTVGEEGAGRVDHFIMGGSGGIDVFIGKDAC